MVKLESNEAAPSGGDFCGAGVFHFVTDSAVVTEGKFGPQLVVENNVLAGNPATEVGKSRREYLDLSADSKSRGKTWNYLHAIGLVSDEQLAAFRAGPTALDFDESQCEGRQFCGKVELFGEKQNPTIGFNYYHVDSKEAANIPKDAESIEIFKRHLASNGAAQQPVGAGAGAAGKGAASGGGQDWSKF